MFSNNAYFRTMFKLDDPTRMNSYLATLLCILSLTFTMAQQYETQHYETIKILEEAEIRYYPPVMKIKANRAGGFGALFGYISGKNQLGQKIAMTTPVYMQKEEGKEVMEFVLPRAFTKEQTPSPLSEEVNVYESQPGYFIAYAFGGYALDWVTKKAIKEVQQIAAAHQISLQGDPVVLVYNSPYKLINRKNEVLFQIDYKAPETTN